VLIDRSMGELSDGVDLIVKSISTLDELPPNLKDNYASELFASDRKILYVFNTEEFGLTIPYPRSDFEDDVNNSLESVQDLNFYMVDGAVGIFYTYGVN
ncbi:unnamed protein product, partial [marine sediment metagenome]